MFRGDPAKREAGESPARSRHCKRGAWADAIGSNAEKALKAKMRKPGDLHEGSSNRRGNRMGFSKSSEFGLRIFVRSFLFCFSSRASAVIQTAGALSFFAGAFDSVSLENRKEKNDFTIYH